MIVELKNVFKTYKGKTSVKALNDLSYEVRQGEIYGLLGPNGSGKTTSINCLLSLLEFDSGEIKVFDEIMSPDRYDLKARIGLVPQNVAVFDELTVSENIDYFCSLYIKDKVMRKQYVMEAIDFVALNGYEKFRPKKLSGGLLRRLNIACGIAHKPELIILDEPTVAVDPQSRNQILENIVKLNQNGATIIYTSHYMEEVEQICNYIVIMDKGEIVAHGSKDTLKAKVNLGETVHLEFAFANPDYLELIKCLPNITDCYYINNEMVIKSAKGTTCLKSVLDCLDDNHLQYEKIYSELPTLNDVFLELTGKELRD